MPPITFTQSSLPPDVEITILSNVYHIHSTILRTCSRFFDKSLSSTWWKDENTHHHRKDGIVYFYELKLDEDCLESSMVEPVPPGMVDDTKNRMIEMEEEDGGSVVGSGSTYSSPNDVFRNNLRQWLRREALERLQYSYSLLFNILHHTFTSISIRWCHELSTYRDVITLADQYCCLRAVAPGVELLLLKWVRGPRKTPGARFHWFWEDLLQLAVKIRSKEIYNDAFVHMVGVMLERPELGKIPVFARDQAEEQYFRLKRLQENVEQKLQGQGGKIGKLYHNSRVIGVVNVDLYREIAPLLCDEGGDDEDKDDDEDDDEDEVEFTKAIAKMLKCNLLLHRGEEFSHFTCAKTGGRYPWDDTSDW